ncbi:hypothetical protein ACPESR_25210 [Nocardia testacea]|uniref:hypothetical protein n=1 Tax=Nocardia testacea TaxID=248551 RepID=UPI003C2FF5C1
MAAEIVFGVVAHPARRAAAQALAGRLDAHLSVDDRGRGPVGNHRAVWTELAAAGAEWGCVLEDDALLVDGFVEQLPAALAAAPHSTVSLYLGTGRPPGIQSRVRAALERADRADACWVTADRMLHAVGICLRTRHIGDMLTHTGRAPKQAAADARWDRWLRARRTRVAYAVPSLIDHADGPTLVDHPDRQPRTEVRRAWRTGARGQWSRASVRL